MVLSGDIGGKGERRIRSSPAGWRPVFRDRAYMIGALIRHVNDLNLTIKVEEEVTHEKMGCAVDVEEERVGSSRMMKPGEGAMGEET
jgi:hypothetical protein